MQVLRCFLFAPLDCLTGRQFKFPVAFCSPFFALTNDHFQACSMLDRQVLNHKHGLHRHWQPVCQWEPYQPRSLFPNHSLVCAVCAAEKFCLVTPDLPEQILWNMLRQNGLPVRKVVRCASVQGWDLYLCNPICTSIDIKPLPSTCKGYFGARQNAKPSAGWVPQSAEWFLQNTTWLKKL